MGPLNDASLSLKQFIWRSQVLNMYRSMNRAARKVSDPQLRKSLVAEVRAGFLANRSMTDPMSLKSTMIESNRQLKQLVALTSNRLDTTNDPSSWINQPGEDGEVPGRVGQDWPWMK